MANERKTCIEWAREQLGKDYVFGADGPDTWDCSGLTRQAWAKAGQPLMAHYTVTQYEKTTHVPLDQAQPGDLLFFGGYDPAAGNPHHVGIYLAEGQMIDAPQDDVPVGIHDYRDYGDVMDVVAQLPTIKAATVVVNPVFAAKDRLITGQQLTAGHQIVSADLTSRLHLQVGDGNLVLAAIGDDGEWHDGVWSSRTGGATAGGQPASRLTVQHDGNVVLTTAEGRPLWSTRTSHQGRVALQLRNNHDVVLQTETGETLWHSATAGRP